MAVVYQHSTSDGVVFYVGIGLKEKRAYTQYNRSSFWKKIAKKHGLSITILHENVTWEEACEIEKELILKHGRRDLKNGTLCNLTDGGEGSPGVIVSKKTKNLLSKQREGRIISEEHKDKIRKTLTGTKRPLDVVEKMSKSMSKRYAEGLEHPNSKKVINTETGEIYESASFLCRLLKISQSALCRKLRGERKNNTIYKYLKDYEQ